MTTTVVHVDKDEYDVYIGRTIKVGEILYRAQGVSWANPYTIGKDGTRVEVIEKYREFIFKRPDLIAHLPELKGKTLGCWCKPEACHGDVLAELADADYVSDLPIKIKSSPRFVEKANSTLESLRGIYEGGEPSQLNKKKAVSKRSTKASIKPASTSEVPLPTSDKRIMAIDPGRTTGLAFRIDGEIRTCVAQNTEEIIELLEGFDLVVIERFATSGRISSHGLHTVNLVGRIESWCQAKDVEYELAAPQQRYSFLPEAKAQLGHVIERSPVAKHEIDALSHLYAAEWRLGQAIKYAEKHKDK